MDRLVPILCAEMVPTDSMASAPRAGFASVLRVREFRLLWLADAQSLLGDQLARVALSVLVYNRTSSSLATASVYALTYLPALLGSLLLGHLADRLPRRALLVGGDLVRALLVVLMAIPGMPLTVVAALLVGVVLVGTPWKAAESALVVDLIDADHYPLGTGLRTATVQAAQLLGFAVGGLAVSLVGPRTALMLDAVSFAISAGLIRVGVRPRPAVAAKQPVTPRLRSRWSGGLRAVFAVGRLRWLLGLAWLAGLLILPEGLAVPYAHAQGGGAPAVGLLLASGPAGVLVGSVVLTRFLSPPRRAALTVPLASAAGVPLVLCGLRPDLTVSLVLWAVSGLCLAYQVQIATEFVLTIPVEIRGQGIALASSGLLAAQGVGLLLGGLATEVWLPSTTIAAAGVAASSLAAVYGWRLHKS